MSRLAKPPDRDVLAKISNAIEVIEQHFQWQGFPSKGTAEEDEIDTDNSDKDYDLDDSEEGSDVFDAEEIEIAIDAFLSQLIKNEIVKKGKGNRAPSMESVFNQMFGEDHEVAKMVEEFEEHVAGYFGWISFDDMKKAYSQLMTIKEILAKMVDGTNE